MPLSKNENILDWTIAALEITSQFESEDGYKGISGNFDGQGVSAGILQWCLGQGSLQSLMKTYVTVNDSIDKLKIFPIPIEGILRLSNHDAVAFAKAHMLNGENLKPEWLKAWRWFMGSPAMIKVQQQAATTIGLRAKAICDGLGLNTKLAFCWAFDLCTQNGGLGNHVMPAPDVNLAKKYIAQVTPFDDGLKNKALWASMIDHVKPYQVSLFILSHQRMLECVQKWQADVMARKGSLSLGKGYVHGSMIDISNVA